MGVHTSNKGDGDAHLHSLKEVWVPTSIFLRDIPTATLLKEVGMPTATLLVEIGMLTSTLLKEVGMPTTILLMEIGMPTSTRIKER